MGMGLGQMSLQGAVLILVVIGIRAGMLDRLPKGMFLVLWGMVLVRLLVPFSISSAWSVYTLADRYLFVEEIEETGVGSYAHSMEKVEKGEGNLVVWDGENMLEEGRTAFPVQTVIWFVGMLSCAVFFGSAYVREYREFRMSLLVREEVVERWMREHRIWRRVSVRELDRILTPLTYGVVRPVILVPKGMDWEDEEQISYILMHEWVHICRLDQVMKFLMVGAVCVHWFNPAVWVMYVVYNRDLELACDACVVRRLGVEKRAAYARMLIAMEEKKSGFLPFCSYFGKDAAQERIGSIMKIKKSSLAAVCMAAVVVGAVSVTFVTSASNDQSMLSREDAKRIEALCFDDYQKMSISEYQKKVWEMTDTKAYGELWERFSRDETWYEMRKEEEILSYLYEVLEPLTAEKWQTRTFGGYAATSYPEAFDQAMLEYVITLTIRDADNLTVEGYTEARLGMMQDLQKLLAQRSQEELRDMEAMEEWLSAEVKVLTEKWSSDLLQIEVEYAYMPLSAGEEGSDDSTGEMESEQEKREYPNATEEDYSSLFTLLTPDYQKRSVADFNQDLLAWANENHERMERIDLDTGYRDYQVALSEKEHYFTEVSVWFSGRENAEYVQSSYTGEKEEDPLYDQYLEEKMDERDGRSAWCDLYYQFTYHIADQKTLTIGERDRAVTGMIEAVQTFWEEADLEELLQMTRQEVVKELQSIAKKSSSPAVSFTILEEQVGFECMDERGIF